jgi:hypothetical protein
MLLMKGDSDEVVDVEVEGEAKASSETVVLVVVVEEEEEEDRSRSSKVDSFTETVPAAGVVVVFFLLEDLAEFWKAFCKLAPEEKARATAGVEE